MAYRIEWESKEKKGVFYSPSLGKKYDRTIGSRKEIRKWFYRLKNNAHEFPKSTRIKTMKKVSRIGRESTIKKHKQRR
jgi:hypothetical protein